MLISCAAKDQEREALEKIRSVISSIGPDGYVGSAMKGVLEVAEANIEHDLSYSLYDSLKRAEKNAETAYAAANASMSRADAYQDRAKLAENRLEWAVHRADGFLAESAALKEQLAAAQLQAADRELRKREDDVLNVDIEKTLENQMHLLSDRSASGDDADLLGLTSALCSVCDTLTRLRDANRLIAPWIEKTLSEHPELLT